MKTWIQILENSKVDKIRKEVESLKKSKRQGKLTVAGKRRLDQLEGVLFQMGIFD